MTNQKRFSDEIEEFVLPWMTSGFAAFHDELCEAVSPSVFYSGEISSDSLPIGSSRIGGRPDLSPSCQWPLTNDGKPLRFRAQVNLSEIANLEISPLLPKKGLLSFFFDTEFDDGNRWVYVWGGELADKDKWKVIYQADSTRLERRDFPYLVPDFARLGTAAITPTRFLTMRPHESEIMKPLFSTPKEEYKFRDINFQSLDKFNQVPCCSLMGHPRLIQEDIQILCQYLHNGIEYCHPSLRDPVLDSGIEDWLLLFQLNAWYEIGVDFPGEGTVYYSIRKQDLANLDFDNVWLMMQAT